jgi:hypothetical protein
MKTKVCRECGEKKSIDCFSPSRRDKHDWVCRTCRGGRVNLMRRYGLTLEQYEAMRLRQGGRCAICGRVPVRRLHVDHDHRTGRVRGLLCQNCNTAIGKLGENLVTMARAMFYLRQYGSRI